MIRQTYAMTSRRARKYLDELHGRNCRVIQREKALYLLTLYRVRILKKSMGVENDKR